MLIGLTWPSRSRPLPHPQNIARSNRGRFASFFTALPFALGAETSVDRNAPFSVQFAIRIGRLIPGPLTRM